MCGQCCSSATFNGVKSNRGAFDAIISSGIKGMCFIIIFLSTFLAFRVACHVAFYYVIIVEFVSVHPMERNIEHSAFETTVYISEIQTCSLPPLLHPNLAWRHVEENSGRREALGSAEKKNLH